MSARFCRDCAHFEERRDIDGIPLCAENIGPFVFCEEFEPQIDAPTMGRFYNRFCVDCANFEEVDGVALCAKNHSPRIACQVFRSRFEKLKAERQNNHMKAVLLIQAANGQALSQSVPSSLTEISRKIKW